jgi:iron complex outermembrane receptor protein
LVWSRVLTAESDGIRLNGNFGFPKDRVRLSTLWRLRMLDAAWNVNLIGKHGDGGFGFVGSHVTHDVQLGWSTPLKGVKLVIGAVNVTEKMPALVSSGVRPYRFLLYDGYGRQAYARLEMRF